MKIRKKNIKETVRQKYDQIASQSKEQNQSSCCGGTDCCGETDYSVFSDDYSEVQGYNEDADLGLGCGIPTEHASLKKGDVVLDLGSGAGNDCFVARSFVGEQGFVYGIDFSKEIHKEKEIVIPEDILSGYLNKDELKSFNESQTGIYSITITAKKEIK